MSAPLSFAIPSKGRLKEQTADFLSGCGWCLRSLDGERGYRAVLDGAPAVDLLLLSAREIAERLSAGSLHLGVTGEDLLHEIARDAAREVHTIERLGFGRADVVVAVPASWVDVASLADLESAGRQFREHHGRRLVVATKYPAITRRHFARAGVTEYRIVDSAGATEAAPAAGTADLIVDITTTGATLRANHLKTLSDGLMLQSEAVLAASLTARWTPGQREALAAMLDTLAARHVASPPVRLELARPLEGETGRALMRAHGLAAVSLEGPVLSLNASPETAPRAARALAKAGYGPVRINEARFEYTAGHKLADAFESAIAAVPGH